jgi:hypothetical protein
LPSDGSNQPGKEARIHNKANKVVKQDEDPAEAFSSDEDEQIDYNDDAEDSRQ